MKRVFLIIVVLAMLMVTACGKTTIQQDWQEQFDLGVRFLNEDNYEEAIIAFEAAIKIEPKNPEAYIGLTDVYIKQGNEDKAREILEKGLDNNPGNEEISEKLIALNKESYWRKYYDAGMESLDEEKIDEAIKAFEKAIAIYPDREDAYIGLANAYIKKGDYDKAEETLEKALKNCGKSDKLNVLYEEVVNHFDEADYFELNKSGVKILDVKFDEMTYLANNPTEFTVTVVYKCPDDKEYYLALEMGDACSEIIPTTGSGKIDLNLNRERDMSYESGYLYVHLADSPDVTAWPYNGLRYSQYLVISAPLISDFTPTVSKNNVMSEKVLNKAIDFINKQDGSGYYWYLGAMFKDLDIDGIPEILCLSEGEGGIGGYIYSLKYGEPILCGNIITEYNDDCYSFDLYYDIKNNRISMFTNEYFVQNGYYSNMLKKYEFSENLFYGYDTVFSTGGSIYDDIDDDPKEKYNEYIAGRDEILSDYTKLVPNTSDILLKYNSWENKYENINFREAYISAVEQSKEIREQLAAIKQNQ